jgi:hypothetical protein
MKAARPERTIESSLDGQFGPQKKVAEVCPGHAKR